MSSSKRERSSQSIGCVVYGMKPSRTLSGRRDFEKITKKWENGKIIDKNAGEKEKLIFPFPFSHFPLFSHFLYFFKMTPPESVLEGFIP